MPPKNAYFVKGGKGTRLRIYNARKKFFAGEPGIYRKRYLGRKRFVPHTGGMHPFKFAKIYKKWKR
jgi:hypothetical protein